MYLIWITQESYWSFLESIFYIRIYRESEIFRYYLFWYSWTSNLVCSFEYSQKLKIMNFISLFLRKKTQISPSILIYGRCFWRDYSLLKFETELTIWTFTPQKWGLRNFWIVSFPPSPLSQILLEIVNVFQHFLFKLVLVIGG